MNDGPPMDKTEGVIRFVCGAGFGTLTFWRFGPSMFWFALVCVLCGYLAYKHGDRFWYKISDWWGIYR